MRAALALALVLVAAGVRGDAGATEPPATPAARAGADADRSDRLQLAPDAVARAGLEAVRVAAATASADVEGFGRVLDPLPLVEAVQARAAARGVAAAARAEYERALRLHRDDQNASARDVESARAARDRASADVTTATARVALAWGAALDDDALVGDLVAGRAAVARIDLPAGEHVAATPASVTVAAVARPERRFQGRVLRPAPTTDPLLQGDGYLVLLTGDVPAPGTALTATLARSRAPLAGVAVPRVAVLWSDGRPVVYVAAADGAFERRAVTLGAPLAGAWLVTEGVAAGERVVTTGAAQLLSAETLGAEPAE